MKIVNLLVFLKTVFNLFVMYRFFLFPFRIISEDVQVLSASIKHMLHSSSIYMNDHKTFFGSKLY